MQKNTTEEIISLFFSTFRAFKHKLDLGSPMFQLPLAQTETLRLIAEKEKIPMKEIADFLAITPPSATAMINNLFRLGYIERSSNKADRRAIYLSLTKKGLSVLQKGAKQRCAVFTKLLDNLDKREQVEFLKLLKKMSVNKGSP